MKKIKNLEDMILGAILTVNTISLLFGLVYCFDRLNDLSDEIQMQIRNTQVEVLQQRAYDQLEVLELGNYQEMLEEVEK